MRVLLCMREVFRRLHRRENNERIPSKRGLVACVHKTKEGLNGAVSRPLMGIASLASLRAFHSYCFLFVCLYFASRLSVCDSIVLHYISESTCSNLSNTQPQQESCRDRGGTWNDVELCFLMRKEMQIILNMWCV